MSRRKDVLRGSHRDFLASYARQPSSAELAVEREVFGFNAGITSYTTPEEAVELADAVALGPGMLLLEVGAGTGWPGVYLAKQRGCEVVLTDVPVPGLRTALKRARKQRVGHQVKAIGAAGSNLPFRPGTFDAIIHCDVLC